MTSQLRTSIFFLLAVGLGFSQDTVNPQIQAIQDFENRLNDYVNLQRNLAKGLSATKSTNDPQLIIERQHQLAQKIRETRNKAQQGEIFTPAVAKEFRRLLLLAMAGPNRADITKSLARSEPVRVQLHVNDSYPANIPLQSTPPTILLNLPRLPTEVEYRIVGHALVLRDAIANVVVDLIPDAIS